MPYYALLRLDVGKNVSDKFFIICSVIAVNQSTGLACAEEGMFVGRRLLLAALCENGTEV